LIPRAIIDDSAKINALKIRVLESEEIVVEGSERAVRTMLDPIIERFDHPVVEVFSPGKSGYDLVTLFGGEFFVAAPATSIPAPA
jgi:predicted TPR repeat methyltransferase